MQSGEMLRCLCPRLSILQLTAIVYFNEPDVISIVSILISMSSVCGKLLLLITEFRGWKIKVFVWLCFVLDFFGVFFVVSFAFYSPLRAPWQHTYFLSIRSLCAHEFLFCVAPFAVFGSVGIHFYWVLQLRDSTSSLHEYCGAVLFVTLCWAVGLLMTLIAMQILSLWWAAFMVLFVATGGRLPWTKGPKYFFERQIRWILHSQSAHSANAVHSERAPKGTDTLCLVSSDDFRQNVSF